MAVPPFHWWRTVFFLIPAIALYTIVLGTLSLLSALVDRQGHLAHRCARAWAWLILKTTGCRSTSRASTHLPRDQPYLFLANHQSIYDIPVLFWHLPYQVRILAKASLGKVPVPRLAPAPQRPCARRPQQSRQLDDAADQGVDAAEGCRSWCSRRARAAPTARVARFRGGIVMLAIEAGLPIVPVSVEGTPHVMLKGRLMTCPGHVRGGCCRRSPTAAYEPAKARELAGVIERQVRAGVEDLQVATT